MENLNLEYNTQREKMAMPEYGRNVLNMVGELKSIPDRSKRSEQAAAVVKIMEVLNPQVRQQENWQHKLWDHLFIIAGFDLDIDSPFPCPVREDFETKPVPLPMKGTKIKATHYGRNIEKILNLVCEEPDGEIKTMLIKSLASYMRTQYLIWNKDSVKDETIFADIEKLSDNRIKVPEGLELGKLSEDIQLSRPNYGQNRNKFKHSGKRNKKRQ